MRSVLTFIIPVRHQENAKNWATVKSNLTQTIKSIENQESPDWKAVIIANRGADLPNIPERFEVKWVSFAPNPLFEKSSAPIDQVYDAIRLDKGRRVLAGMLHAKKMGHVMIVDDDDLVHRKLTSFVLDNPSSDGFFIEKGYVWGSGENWVLKYDGNFSHLCGTSHIIRSDLYNLPSTFEDATEEYIKTMLGSHIFIFKEIKNAGKFLSPLPFYGAIYRVGHSENHSQNRSMIKNYLFQKYLWRDPIRQLKRLFHLKRLNNLIIKDFFGDYN